MRKPTLTLPETKFLNIATFVAIGFGAYLLRGYFQLIVVAGILAYLFNPIYLFYKKYMNNGAAAALTLITNIFMVVIPLFLIGFFAIGQLRSGIHSISQQAAALDTSNLGDQIITWVNDLLKRVPFGNYSITQGSFISATQQFISSSGTRLLGYLTSFAGSFISTVASLVVYVYLFLSLLINGPKIIEVFKRLNPLGPEISDMYLSRSAAMVRGTMRGQFVIAAVQGFIGATTIALAGLPSTFFIFFIVLTLLSIIPLGGGVLTIPIGIAMIIFGNVTGGLIIIVGHFVMTTNIDGVLRPALIPKDARIDSALMLISVFAGIAMFGFLGIVLGPTIIILVITTIQVYLLVQKNYELQEPHNEKSEKYTKDRLKKILYRNNV